MSHSNSMKNNQPDDPLLDAKVLDALGRALSAHYDDVVRAPLPDRFLDLLEELDKKERRAGLPGDADAAR
jgi:Anti-sigma factor NepR